LTTNQEIVPVRLWDDKKKSYNQTQQHVRNQQKLIARIKNMNSELFIYEGIRDEVLRILLTELYKNEAN
jgi:hypothetical protein